jgi:hypothetical protein
MKAVTALAAVLLCATALAILPAARASQQPCLDALGSGCGPNPVPLCRSQEISTAPILDAYGASVTVRLNSNCTVSVLVVCPTTDTAIPPALPPLVGGSSAIAVPISHGDVQTHADCTAWANETNTPCPNGFWHAPVSVTEGPVHITADSCVPMCACYPMGAPAVATIAPVANLPPLGTAMAIPPPCQYCAPPACAPHEVASTEATVYERSDCSVLVDAHDRVTCSKAGWWPSTVDRKVGAEEARATVCLPEIECACDPLLAPAAASVPIECIMAPCGPECIVPCVPQVVPGDCDLREATPQTVGPFLIPANPRTMVWGSDPSDCTIDAHEGGSCPPGTDEHTLSQRAGPVLASVTVCTPGLDCTCDPILKLE